MRLRRSDITAPEAPQQRDNVENKDRSREEDEQPTPAANAERHNTSNYQSQREGHDHRADKVSCNFEGRGPVHAANMPASPGNS